jgi:TonB family protein
MRRLANRARGYLSRGALLSLLIHANLLVPIGIAAWVYGGREEAQRAEDMDVAFEDASTANLPKDLPPLEPLPPDDLAPPKPPKPERKKPDRKLTQEDKKKPKPAEKQPPPKQEEVVVPPLPPMPPPPPPEHKAHEKIVELDDEDKKVEPPPDAKYLAQHNSKTDVETRARDTNLEKSQKGEAQESSPSKREDQQVGGEKEKIAELQDQKSELGRKAPDVTPHVNPETASPAPKDEQPEKKSLLSLRDPAPRQHELTPETADLSLPKAADGDVMQQNRAVRGDKSDAARQSGKKVKLALSAKDYEYLFGADAEAERRLASKQKSTRQGKFQQRVARVQAALENFIPEVKPGNQTALNARAAPFAAYIARMHRSIHRLWGFGQLEDWDELSGSSPFNNQNLETTLEMVLNRDGTIDKVTIVRTSGYLPYDAAAIDVAYTAGPYPDPPREIRSANGKIYVHWHFFRDGRQCTPAFTDYYILDNHEPGADRPSQGEGSGEAAPAGSAGNGAAASERPALADSTGGGPRRLNRYEPSERRGAARSFGGEGEGAEAAPQKPAAEPAPEPKPAGPRAVDPAARTVAAEWFAGLAAGKTPDLAAAASLPFKTTGRDVTTRATLTAMLSDLAREGVGGGGEVQVLTAAGLRAAIGKLPPNLDDGSGQLYAISAAGAHDALILILSQRGGLWRVSGLVRR